MPSKTIKPEAKLGLALAILASIVYGFYGPATRAAYSEGANAALLILCTTLARGFTFSLYCFSRGLKLFHERENRGKVLIAGILQACNTIALWYGLTLLEAPIVAIIFCMAPFLIWAFHIRRGESKFRLPVFLLCLLATLGLSLVLDVWNVQSTVNWYGVGLIVAATFMLAIRTDLYARLMKRKTPHQVGAENNVIASVFVLPILLWQTPQLPATMGYMWIGIAVLSVLLGAFMTYSGIKLLGSFSWSMLANFEPVIVALVSFWLINEALSTLQYVGMAIVIVSLLAYFQVSHAKTPQPAEGAG